MLKLSGQSENISLEPLAELEDLVELQIDVSPHRFDLSPLLSLRNLYFLKSSGALKEPFLHLPMLTVCDDKDTVTEYRTLIQNLLREIHHQEAPTIPSPNAITESKECEVPAKMDADEFLAALNGVGWFDKLPQEAMQRTRDGVADALQQGQAPWNGLPAVGFDVECVYGEGIISGLLLELAEASFGVLKIKDAEEIWKSLSEDEAPEITLTAMMGRKKLRFRFRSQGDYVPDGFFACIEELMQASNTELRFLALPGSDQTVQLVLALPGAFEKAIAQGLIGEFG